MINNNYKNIQKEKIEGSEQLHTILCMTSHVSDLKGGGKGLYYTLISTGILQK